MKARCEFIALSADAGVDVGPLVDQAVAAFREKLSQVVSISVQDGSDILKCLNECGWPDSHKKTTVALVNDKVRMSPTAQSAAFLGCQTFEHFEHFLTQEDWDALQQSDDDAAIQRLAHRAMQLGLRNPTEQSVKRIVSLRALQHKVVDARLVLHWGRSFKLLVRACPCGPRLQKYPRTPQELQSQNPALYAAAYEGTAGPTAAQCNRMALLRYQHLAPCRNTKTGCQSVPPARNQQPRTSVMDALASALSRSIPLPLCDAAGPLAPSPPPTLANAAAPEPAPAPLWRPRPTTAPRPWTPDALDDDAFVEGNDAELDGRPLLDKEPAQPLDALLGDMQQIMSRGKDKAAVSKNAPRCATTAAARRPVLKKPAAAKRTISKCPRGFEERVFKRSTDGRVWKLWVAPDGKTYRSLKDIERRA